ncbi:CBN-RFS-1 protein [Caenorhabditis brenneri]|uniref:CBN-RFS-1 protein n=1 Tax=Caenorhabditis brenneri TaxID=135651 RepID=G0N5G1_CAEBE|nr:CBN-RFS-1 protein [Caenorhabditis brenneri]
MHSGDQKSCGSVEDLDRIFCKQVEKTNELRDSLNSFLEMVNIQLVVVENIDALLHDTAYDRDIGRSVQSDIADRFRRLTRAGITVVVTNHITYWRGYPAPALGAFWASQIKNRFYVEKQSDDSDVRSVSTMNEVGEGTRRVQFRIGDNGLEPVRNS